MSLRSTAAPVLAPGGSGATGAPASPALLLMAGGVCAALHVGKLAPAVAALQAALGLTLVQAGFLLSGVQIAGMLLGVALGAVADGLGGRRSMVGGLLLLALASGAGGAVGGAAGGADLLLVLRALEGLGFLLVVLPVPGLLRQWLPPQRIQAALGVWGAYMPLATALALLLGPLVIELLGWRAWWWLLAAVSAVMALLLQWRVPAQPPGAPMAVAVPAGPGGPTAAASGPAAAAGPADTAGDDEAAQRSSTKPPTAAAVPGWAARLRQTLGASGPWLVALSFALYSSQWLAVIGFLPTVVAQAGAGAAATAVLTAAVAAANIVGNVAAGRLLQRGVRPTRLLALGFCTMALAATAAFAGLQAGPRAGSPMEGAGLEPALRFAAVLLFSAVGGVIPGTLFSLAVRLAPGPHALATTVGWVQQWSSLGQFAGPPAVAWAASHAGGWQATPLVTAACAALGLLLTLPLARRLAR